MDSLSFIDSLASPVWPGPLGPPMQADPSQSFMAAYGHEHVLVGDTPGDRALGTESEGETIFMTANFTGDVAIHMTHTLPGPMQNGEDPTIPCPQLTVVMDPTTKSCPSCPASRRRPAVATVSWRFKVCAC